MSPESGPGGGRLRINTDQGNNPNAERLRIHHSLHGMKPEASGPPESRVRYNFGSPETNTTPVEAGAETASDVRNEVLANEEDYTVTERDGRLYAGSGDKVADVTDLLAPGLTLDRFRPQDPSDPHSPVVLTESLTITSLTRTSMGEQAGKLRVGLARQGGGRLSIGLDELGVSDTERRKWRIPPVVEPGH